MCTACGTRRTLVSISRDRRRQLSNHGDTRLQSEGCPPDFIPLHEHESACSARRRVGVQVARSEESLMISNGRDLLRHLVDGTHNHRLSALRPVLHLLYEVVRHGHQALLKITGRRRCVVRSGNPLIQGPQNALPAALVLHTGLLLCDLARVRGTLGAKLVPRCRLFSKPLLCCLLCLGQLGISAVALALAVRLGQTLQHAPKLAAQTHIRIIRVRAWQLAEVRHERMLQADRYARRRLFESRCGAARGHIPQHIHALLPSAAPRHRIEHLNFLVALIRELLPGLRQHIFLRSRECSRRNSLSNGLCVGSSEKVGHLGPSLLKADDGWLVDLTQGLLVEKDDRHPLSLLLRHPSLAAAFRREVERLWSKAIAVLHEPPVLPRHDSLRNHALVPILAVRSMVRPLHDDGVTHLGRPSLGLLPLGRGGRSGGLRGRRLRPSPPGLGGRPLGARDRPLPAGGLDVHLVRHQGSSSSSPGQWRGL
mmetsp:Transcript_52255/g.127659  ORF Transcript_52255/g.127659 Transcript_52255/m.127659 type:complete len:481 (+) Transcript_52255:3590-5032(+)